MKEIEIKAPVQGSGAKNKLESIRNKCRYLDAMGKEYEFACVNGSYELKSSWFNDSYQNRRLKLTPKELGFIKRVKNYVVKNEIYSKFEDQYFSDDVIYMESNMRLKGRVMNGIIEMDINHAYWKTAHMLGAISDKLYYEGLDQEGGISKVARLVALGALAKKKTYYKIKGGKMKESHVERSLLTENIWFTICHNVSKVMQDVAISLGKDYLFYWVDGIYMKNDPESVQLAKVIFEQNGYGVKTKEMYRVDFNQENFTIYSSKSDFDSPYDEEGNTKDGVRTFQYVDRNSITITKRYSEHRAILEYVNSVIKKNKR